MSGPIINPPAVLGDAAAAKTPTSPYLALIDAIQNAQEKDNRAMREMLENRSGRLAVIRSLQASDANTVATFEKLIAQLKEDSSNANPVPANTVKVSSETPPSPPKVDPSLLPPVPTTPVKADAGIPASPNKEDSTTLPPVPTIAVKSSGGTPAAPNDMQKLLQELEQLSQKVKDLSSQLSPQEKN